MIKKNLILILCFFILCGCGYTPIYSQKNINTSFSITNLEFEGDSYINNVIKINLKRYTNSERVRNFNVSVFTDYKKNITAKDLKGSATNYQLVLKTIIKIEEINSKKPQKLQLVFEDSFNMEKNEDKYEQDSYERLLKKSLAETIYDKIIFNLSKTNDN